MQTLHQNSIVPLYAVTNAPVCLFIPFSLCQRNWETIAADMADTYHRGVRRRAVVANRSRATRESPGREADVPCKYEPLAFGNSVSEKNEGKRKGRPKVDNLALQDIPARLMTQWKEEFKTHSRVKCPNSGCWLEFPSIYGLKYHYPRCRGGALAEKLIYACRYCEASFTSKTRLEKHKAWNHADKLSADIRAWNQVRKFPDQGNLTKRVAESSVSFTKRARQARLNKLASQRHLDNGVFVHDFRGCNESRISVASSMAMKAESNRELQQDGGSLSPEEEEDPERMRHRRKQKTPKKFTGEQPSISGTFGLKGLGKEEKGKGGRPRKLEGTNRRAVIRRRPLGLSARREAAVYTPGSVEDTWQREIVEKGEILCSKCKCVTRKTILGLRKHMDVCQKLQDALKCQYCKKQFKSKAGLNYHTMAEHINKPDVMQAEGLSEHEERERLRKVLKQMGKLKCPNEGCTATFTSLMGYQYHLKRCGKEPCEVEKPVFACRHCEKTYKSKAGHDYHVRSEHTLPIEDPQENLKEELVEDFERTPSGRIRRRSAQVAVFHLQEIAEDELAKDWNKRRMKDDLVPDTKLLNYIRPGLPKFHPQLLENWKNEVKEQGQIMCPNHSCQAIYSSVSGLKAHLASCNKGEHSVGKYRCLLCFKEFSSESGVKYHIMKTHSQNWFRTSIGAVPTRKYQEPVSTFRATQKSTTGKKRGRKPKERLLVTFPVRGKGGMAAKTELHHKKMMASNWEVTNSSIRTYEGRERANIPSSLRKGVGSSKLPEK